MKHSTINLLKQYGLTIFLAAAVSLGIRFYILESYYISTSFMMPSLFPGDTIFVEKWSFLLASEKLPVTRGDIIIYSGAKNSPRAKKEFVRRIVGLPGDEVQLFKGKFFLNGSLIQKTNENSPTYDCVHEKPPGTLYEVCYSEPRLEDFGPLKIEAGQLFVIGDYRSHEIKGHPIWEKIHFNQIVGKARLIWLSVDTSPNRLSFFPRFKWNRIFKSLSRTP